MKQRVQSVNLNNKNDLTSNHNRGRISYPMKGDSNLYEGMGKRHYWARTKPYVQSSLHDNQFPVNNMSPGEAPLNFRQNTDAKSLDYLRYKRPLNESQQHKLSKSRAINLIINPQQIRLQSNLKNMKVEKIDQEVQYNIQAGPDSRNKSTINHQILNPIPIINNNYTIGGITMKNKIENRYKTNQINMQKSIQHAQRQYFQILHKPQKIKLPNIDKSLMSPKKGDFQSEYHHSFNSKQKKKNESDLCDNLLRKQLRKINPTFTSSLNNPLSDLNFQIKLLSQNRRICTQ